MRSTRRHLEHQHLTASDPKQNPREVPIRVPGISSPVFVDSSGYPSGNPSDKPTKNTSPVTIIKPTSVPNRTKTKYTSYVPKELTIAKKSNMLIDH